jgi:hypothetical protein
MATTTNSASLDDVSFERGDPCFVLVLEHSNNVRYKYIINGLRLSMGECVALILHPPQMVGNRRVSEIREILMIGCAEGDRVQTIDARTDCGIAVQHVVDDPGLYAPEPGADQAFDARLKVGPEEQDDCSPR